MRNYFLFRYWFVLGAFALGVLSACNKTGSNPLSSLPPLVPKDLSEKLNYARNSNIDSAKYYTDIIIAYIQENNLSDSLYILYNSIKVDLLIKSGQQNEALQLLLENRLLAGNLRDSSLLAKTSFDLGDYYVNISQYDLALPYFEAAKSFYKNNTLYLESIKLLSNLGYIFLNKSNFYKALEYFNQVKNLYAAKQDTINLAYTLSDISYCMNQLGLSEAALDPLREGIQILEALPNQLDKGSTLASLAINYKFLYPDSAIYYQKKAIDLTLAVGDSLSWIANLYNMGNAMQRLGRYEESEKILQQVLEYCQQRDIKQGITLSLTGLGTLYAQSGRPLKALQYANRADAELKQGGSDLGVEINIETIISAYTQLGDLQKVQAFQGELDSLQTQIKLQQAQNTAKYLEEAIIAERTAFGNQVLQQNNKAAAENVKRTTIVLILLSAFMVISTLFWFIWRREYIAAQFTTQALLKRYAAEIQQKRATSSASSATEEASLHSLAQRLTHLMESRKIYLDPNLKGEDIMDYLAISYKDLNHLLKSQFKTSLPQLINQYRVKTARQLLSNPDNKLLSIDEIATLSGFGTRQSFHKAFQMQTGVTPGVFRDYIGQQSTNASN